MLKTRFGALAIAAAFVAVGCDDAPTETDAGAMDGAVSSCATGETDCSGECADLTRDRDHCGACGTVCGGGEACNAGSCETVCPSGQDVCGAGCFDLEADRNHCGDCATSCGAGEVCASGSCELSCPTGFTICGGACVNTDADPAYCGDCDTACESGEVCSAGVCASSCGTGLTDCSGACVDVQNDPTHCGDCTTACSTDVGASGICMAGGCRTVCDPGVSDCNADLGATGGDGCETSSATDVNNCGACGLACTLANATAGCVASACTVATCDTGYDDCDTDPSNGCEVELATDENHCGVCGTLCASTETCVSGSCMVAVGEDCATSIALTVGANTVNWLAFTNDYLTTLPGCVPGSYTPMGPDIVLTYTATGGELVTVSFAKPTSTRWAATVSTATCGTLAPELTCLSEFTAATMNGSFGLTAGQTATIYVIDTSSGTLPLSSPLSVDVTVIACSALSAPTLAPASGTTSSTLSPDFVATFAAPVDPGTGIITLTGSMGTTYTLDLSTSPTGVVFSSSDTVMTISPGAFAPGEVVTVSWTGLQYAGCATAITAPTWTVTMPVPPCVPGTGGMVGTTAARLSTGLTSMSEYYAASDESATGYVYIGGLTDLRRLPKAGGTLEDVDALAGITSSQLGYEMLIVGNEIFVVNDSATGTTGKLWRISTTGGSTWITGGEDYASFATAPNDDFRGAAAYGGTIYLATQEASAGTEIWSVPAGASTLPVAASLVATVPYDYCSGLAADSAYVYTVCDHNPPYDVVLRINRATMAAEELVTTWTANFTRNAIQVDDTDADGVADILYVNVGTEAASYVCGLGAGATIYSDDLTSWGTGTSNYGLAFDATNNTLYGFDDDTYEFVSIR
jgi:hypothetical protein